VRYWKGSIQLSASQDYPLLRQVLRSEHITHSQLFEFMRFGCHERSRQSFAWRVRRLVRRGLVKQRQTKCFGGEPVYSLSRETALELQGLEEYCVVSAKPSEGDGANDVLHAVELNNIHLSLLRAHMPARWIPTTEVRSINELSGLPYVKIYDAVVDFSLNGTSKKVALEYERSRKAKTNYADIARDTVAEQRVALILYLVANYDLLKFLTHEFWGISRHVVFGLVREWHNRLLEMPVIAPDGSGSRPLLEFLI
jgi:hypothetical protein